MLVLAVALVVAAASPAAADPAAPTNYSSTVRSIEPATDAVHASVVGGDAFLELRVARGHEVIVAGYSDEPYLRFDADGRVEENTNSPAVVLNQSRYGKIDTNPPAANAAPAWKVIASGGLYVWHDHRIHFMGTGTPTALRGCGTAQPVASGPAGCSGASTGKAFDWSVPLQVDGAAVTIHGDLFLKASPSALPWLALGVIAFVAFGALLMWRRSLAAVVLAACALLAFVISFADQQSLPAAAGRQFSLYVTAGIAALCALAAALRPRSKYANVLKIACALVLPLWIVRYASSLTKAVLPGDVSPLLVRSTVALAAAVVLAYAAVEIQHEVRSAEPNDA